LIEFYGLDTADDECSPCTPGYYTNFEGKEPRSLSLSLSLSHSLTLGVGV